MKHFLPELTVFNLLLINYTHLWERKKNLGRTLTHTNVPRSLWQNRGIPCCKCFSTRSWRNSCDGMEKAVRFPSLHLSVTDVFYTLKLWLWLLRSSVSEEQSVLWVCEATERSLLRVNRRGEQHSLEVIATWWTNSRQQEVAMSSPSSLLLSVIRLNGVQINAATYRKPITPLPLQLHRLYSSHDMLAFHKRTFFPPCREFQWVVESDEASRWVVILRD